MIDPNPVGPENPEAITQIETEEVVEPSVFTFFEADCLSHLSKSVYSDYEKISQENVISVQNQELIIKWFQEVYFYEKKGSFKAYELLYRIGTNICYIIQEYLNRIENWMKKHKDNPHNSNVSDLLIKKSILLEVLNNELVSHELIGKFCLSAIGRSDGQLIDTQEQSYEFHGGSLYMNLSMFELTNGFMVTSIPFTELTDDFPNLALSTKHYNSACTTVEENRRHSYNIGSYTFSNVNVESFVCESSKQTLFGGLSAGWI